MSLVECIQDQGSYFRKLKIELESEKNIIKELETTKANRERIEREIEIKKKEIVSLEEQSKKEFKDVRKMKHLTFRSAAATLSGKKKEKIEKEEAKYQLAFENEKRSKRELEELEIEYSILVTKEAELSAQKNEFESVNLQLESLLDQIFQIEDPAFPREQQIKAELSNYREQRHLALRDKGRFIKAEKYLIKAMDDLKVAIQVLDTAINYESFDIFGTSIIDENQVAFLEAAKKKVYSIQRSFDSARNIVPEIPYPHLLEVVANNPLLSIQNTPGFYDIAWRTKATQCYSIVAIACGNTQNSINWVRQYKDYASNAFEQLNTAMNQLKITLKNERIRFVEVVLSGPAFVPSNGGSSSSQALSNDFSPSAVPYDLPPPVYEAPTSTVNPQATNNEQAPIQSLNTDFSNFSINSSPSSNSTVQNNHNPFVSSSGAINQSTPIQNPTNPFLQFVSSNPDSQNKQSP